MFPPVYLKNSEQENKQVHNEALLFIAIDTYSNIRWTTTCMLKWKKFDVFSFFFNTFAIVHL